MQQKQNNAFFTFLLSKLPQTLPGTSPVPRLWCRTILPGCNFAPSGNTTAPHLSGRTFCSSCIEVLGSAVLCSLQREAQLSPGPPPAGGAASQRLSLQEATAQSQARGLGCGHLPISPRSFHAWDSESA